jgi:hypothetical protein
MTRPEGAEESLLSIIRLVNIGPLATIFRPFRAVRLSCPFLGLKPQAQSYYPFGISSTASIGTESFIKPANLQLRVTIRL